MVSIYNGKFELDFVFETTLYFIYIDIFFLTIIMTSQVAERPEPLCHIITPIGMLGYGFNTEDVEKGLELFIGTQTPTAIILDSGSTDSGPSKLALGSTTCPRSSYERDLRQLIHAVQTYRVPLLISSAGGDGSNAHVKEFLDIIGEILDSPEHG